MTSDDGNRDKKEKLNKISDGPVGRRVIRRYSIKFPYLPWGDCVYTVHTYYQ